MRLDNVATVLSTVFPDPPPLLLPAPAYNVFPFVQLQLPSISTPHPPALFLPTLV